MTTTETITTDTTTALLMLPRFQEQLFQPAAVADLMRRIALSAIDAIEAEEPDLVLRTPATPDEVRLYEDMITDEDRMFSDVHGDDADEEDAA